MLIADRVMLPMPESAVLHDIASLSGDSIDPVTACKKCFAADAVTAWLLQARADHADLAVLWASQVSWVIHASSSTIIDRFQSLTHAQKTQQPKHHLEKGIPA